MNNAITIQNATRELGNIKSCPVIDRPVRDSAQWADIILSELRQQLGLSWDAPMADLYKAVVNYGAV